VLPFPEKFRRTIDFWRQTFVHRTIESRLLQHFVIGEPQHRVAERFEELRPLAIRVELPLMVITVDLNNEAPPEADEVDDKAPDGLLDGGEHGAGGD